MGGLYRAAATRAIIGPPATRISYSCRPGSSGTARRSFSPTHSPDRIVSGVGTGKAAPSGGSGTRTWRGRKRRSPRMTPPAVRTESSNGGTSGGWPCSSPRASICRTPGPRNVTFSGSGLPGISRYARAFASASCGLSRSRSTERPAPGSRLSSGCGANHGRNSGRRSRICCSAEAFCQAVAADFVAELAAFEISRAISDSASSRIRTSLLPGGSGGIGPPRSIQRSTSASAVSQASRPLSRYGRSISIIVGTFASTYHTAPPPAGCER